MRGYCKRCLSSMFELVGKNGHACEFCHGADVRRGRRVAGGDGLRTTQVQVQHHTRGEGDHSQQRNSLTLLATPKR